MESREGIEMERKVFAIDPKDIVKRIVAIVEGYGLDEGLRAFKETERVMGFVAWWEAEVSAPVMRFFGEVRTHERREGHAMELERLRAGAPSVSISQPQAQTGVALPYGGSGIDQLNLLEPGANAAYNHLSNT